MKYAAASGIWVAPGLWPIRTEPVLDPPFQRPFADHYDRSEHNINRMTRIHTTELIPTNPGAPGTPDTLLTGQRIAKTLHTELQCNHHSSSPPC